MQENTSFDDPELRATILAATFAELRKAEDEDAAINAVLAIKQKDPNSRYSRQLVVPKRHRFSEEELENYPLGGACKLRDLIQGPCGIEAPVNGFCDGKATQRHHMVEISEGRAWW